MTDLEAARAGTARFIVGDVFDVLATLEDGSIDLVLTSPPFLALRSYLPAEHELKHLEIGSEPTPAAFLDTLLALTAEWRRVLAPHGSICVELGDTYAGSGGAGGDYAEGGMRDGQEAFTGSASRSGWHRLGQRAEQADQPPNYRKSGTVSASDSAKGGTGWPLPKSLCGIPHLYHLSLAYGRNLLTGEPSPAGSWRVRNVVAWCRPNPPVGALGDKFRPGTSYMTVACVSGQRYFDLDAVRSTNNPDRMAEPGFNNARMQDERSAGGRLGSASGWNPAGAPPLDWWKISTEPFKGSHYATWPTELLTRPILSMCPMRVCTTCAEPSRRIVAKSDEYELKGRNWADAEDGRGKASGRERNNHSGQPPGDHIQAAEYLTTGWTDCGHNTWRNGRVLDPFAGSGTTLLVATGHGRDAIGVDIDSRNAELARERVGMFLEVEHAEAVAVRTPDERRLL